MRQAYTKSIVPDVFGYPFSQKFWDTIFKEPSGATLAR
jgi:hypothetical protein